MNSIALLKDTEVRQYAIAMNEELLRHIDAARGIERKLRELGERYFPSSHLVKLDAETLSYQHYHHKLVSGKRDPTMVTEGLIDGPLLVSQSNKRPQSSSSAVRVAREVSMPISEYKRVAVVDGAIIDVGDFPSRSSLGRGNDMATESSLIGRLKQPRLSSAARFRIDNIAPTK
jgi:hypothetical protein